MTRIEARGDESVAVPPVYRRVGAGRRIVPEGGVDLGPEILGEIVRLHQEASAAALELGERPEESPVFRDERIVDVKKIAAAWEGCIEGPLDLVGQGGFLRCGRRRGRDHRGGGSARSDRVPRNSPWACRVVEPGHDFHGRAHRGCRLCPGQYDDTIGRRKPRERIGLSAHHRSHAARSEVIMKNGDVHFSRRIPSWPGQGKGGVRPDKRNESQPQRLGTELSHRGTEMREVVKRPSLVAKHTLPQILRKTKSGDREAAGGQGRSQ